MKKQSSVNNRKPSARGPSIIRVLIVEDSFTVARYLEHIINADERLQVIGVARDGREGVKLARTERPDIITMDIHMPGMDGYEATRKIMAESPVPVVVITSNWHPESVRNSFRAMASGALTALEKPPGPGHARSKQLAENLVQTIKTMAEVKVVRRFPERKREKCRPPVPPPAVSGRRIDVVAMGASTGGPPVIKEILCGLRKGFSVPILAVQHIAAGFLEGMVQWLCKESGLRVRIASEGERIGRDTVYFAPEGLHMGVTSAGRIALWDGPDENGVRPSVSYLFRSVARAYGKRAAGILLTGMGRDGAAELAEMREKGAVTMAQDRDTCAVYGMPAEAVKLDRAIYVLPPEGITRLLNSVCRD